MNAAPIYFPLWPEMPALPLPGQPVLVRVATSPSHPLARQELRAVLRQILAAWSHILPEQVPLLDTPRGPVWSGQCCQHPLDISLAYTEDTGLIGLLRAGSIGVDAMSIQRFPEMDAVALHYLGTAALKTVQRAADPPTAFAVAWTELEARVKCLKRDLNEWSSAQAQAFAAHQCDLQNMVIPDNLIVSVATTR